MSVQISDECDNLKVFHYTDCTIESDESIKEMRGVVKNGSSIVCRSFSFTPEFCSNDQSLLNHAASFKDAKAFISQEGSLLRLWNHEGKWRLSTHRKLDAFCSRWGSETSYGSFFIRLLLQMEQNEKEEVKKEEELVFDRYCSSLNPNLVYIFLLRSYDENRVVCNKFTEPVLFRIGAFKRPTEPSEKCSEWDFLYANEIEEAKFPCIEEFPYSSTEDLIQKVENIDIYESQGLVLIRPNGDNLKIVNSQYDALFKLRDNNPNVIARYLYLRNDSNPNQLLAYKALYPEHKKDFQEADAAMKSIIQNIH